MGRGRVHVESAYAPGVRERFPMVPQDGVMGEIKLVDADGRVLGALAHLYRLWPIRPIADAGYRVIARNRYRISGKCEDGTCDLPNVKGKS